MFVLVFPIKIIISSEVPNFRHKVKTRVYQRISNYQYIKPIMFLTIVRFRTKPFYQSDRDKTTAASFINFSLISI